MFTRTLLSAAIFVSLGTVAFADAEVADRPYAGTAIQHRLPATVYTARAFARNGVKPVTAEERAWFARTSSHPDRQR